MATTREQGTPAADIERARLEDYPLMRALLERSNLEADGLREHMGAALVARQPRSDQIVGSAALELYGPYGLLRSVAVDERLRGTGLGRALTQAAIALARQEGLRTLYLLTETAGDFFPKFGFRPVSREDVPAEVQQSMEFVTMCPASALAMALDLA